LFNVAAIIAEIAVIITEIAAVVVVVPAVVLQSTLIATDDGMIAGEILLIFRDCSCIALLAILTKLGLVLTQLLPRAVQIFLVVGDGPAVVGEIATILADALLIGSDIALVLPKVAAILPNITSVLCYIPRRCRRLRRTHAVSVEESKAPEKRHRDVETQPVLLAKHGYSSLWKRCSGNGTGERPRTRELQIRS
jgi:hypothetical protein